MITCKLGNYCKTSLAFPKSTGGGGGGGGVCLTSLWENPVLVHIQAAVIHNKSDTIHKVGKELFWQKKPQTVTQQTCLYV